MTVAAEKYISRITVNVICIMSAKIGSSTMSVKVRIPISLLSQCSNLKHEIMKLV
jgi:hypothetical protein